MIPPETVFRRSWTPFMKKLLILSLPLTAVFEVSSAFAQPSAPPPSQPSLGQVIFEMAPMLVTVTFIFYLLVIRPQQQKLRSQQLLLSSLKKGENVITTGGILGRVVSVEEEYVVIEIAPNTKIKVEKTHIHKREGTKVAEKSAA